MKNNLCLFILSTFSFGSFSQKSTQELLIGEWEMTGIKYLPYFNASDSFPILETKDDVRFKLKFDSTKFTKVYKLKRDNIYNYNSKLRKYVLDEFLLMDSSTTNYTYNENILINNGKRSISTFFYYKRKRKTLKTDPFHAFSILKINHNKLILEEEKFDEDSELFNFTRVHYYFKRISDSTQPKEINLKGKWYINNELDSVNKFDTLMLTRESYEYKQDKSTIKLSIDFTLTPEGKDEFQYGKSISSGLEGLYLGLNGNWQIYSEGSKQILFLGDNRKFQYYFENEKLYLIKL